MPNSRSVCTRLGIRRKVPVSPLIRGGRQHVPLIVPPHLKCRVPCSPSPVPPGIYLSGRMGGKPEVGLEKRFWKLAAPGRRVEFLNAQSTISHFRGSTSDTAFLRF